MLFSLVHQYLRSALKCISCMKTFTENVFPTLGQDFISRAWVGPRVTKKNKKKKQREDTRHVNRGLLPTIRGRRNGKQRITRTIYEPCEIRRDLIPWDVHDVKNAARQSPRRPNCVGDKLWFPEIRMCKYSKSHFCDTPSVTQRTTAQQ